MLKIIKSQEYKIMPWKNGQGVTAEIEIFPAHADFAANDFTWRLSSATIKASSPFSTFEGFERLLTIWKGDGLVLNGLNHLPLTPFAFSGEIPMECVPVGGEVTDLGLIYRRGKVQAEMTLKIFPGYPLPKNLHLEAGVHFFVCIKGTFKAGDLTIAEGDTLKCDGGEQTLAVETAHGAHCFHVHIRG